MRTTRPTLDLYRPGLARSGLVRRSLLGVGLAAPMLWLTGCGTSEPSYYTLTPWPGVARPGGPLTVEVRTPSIAPYLDRDGIVRNDRDYHLTIAQGAAWASPLADLIGRTLALDIGQRLPGSSVHTQSDAISTPALALVEIDVSRFMEGAPGQAEIGATLSVFRPGGGPAGSRAVHVTEHPTDDSVGALVAALSQLLGQVADMAADALQRLPPTA